MTSVFKVRIDGFSDARVKETLEKRLRENEKTFITTLNAEILLSARRDSVFRSLLNRADINVIDGAGPYFALRLTGKRVSRVTGVDLVFTIASIAEKTGRPLLLIGGGEGVAKMAEVALKAQFPNLTIITLNPGEVTAESKILVPGEGRGLALLAFGAKKQEAIGERLLREGGASLAIGVGGAFDMIAGNLPRAPKFFRAFGLEWLWRLALQPYRLPRILRATIVFPIFFIYDSFLGNHTL